MAGLESRADCLENDGPASAPPSALSSSQRAILAADLVGVSDRDAAVMFGSSKGQINAARKLKRLSKALYEDVRCGKVGIQAALRAAQSTAPAAKEIKMASNIDGVRRRPPELSRFLNWIVSGGEIADQVSAEMLAAMADEYRAGIDADEARKVMIFIRDVLIAMETDRAV